MPKRLSSACIANCGWSERPARRSCPARPGRRRWSARRFRRDRCRAPAAPPRRAAAMAMVRAASRSPASSRSSRRRSPVPPGCREPRGFRLDQAVAALRGLDRADLLEIAGHISRAIFRNRASAASICRMVGHQLVEARHGTLRVTMSSISRARSPASASAAAADGDEGPPPRMAGRFAHCRTRCVSVSRRSSSPSAGGRSSDGAKRTGRGLGEHAVRPRRCRRWPRCAAGSRHRLQHIEKDVAREPAGAPGRQIERRVGERERIGGRRETRDDRPSSGAQSASAGTAPRPGIVNTRFQAQYRQEVTQVMGRRPLTHLHRPPRQVLCSCQTSSLRPTEAVRSKKTRGDVIMRSS